MIASWLTSNVISSLAAVSVAFTGGAGSLGFSESTGSYLIKAAAAAAAAAAASASFA